MNLRRRLQALESRLVVGAIVLRFADGATAAIPSRVKGKDHAMDLLADAIRGERSREIDLLMRAVSITEPDGGHLAELALAIALSPTE